MIKINKKDEITRLFYDEHKRPTDIAEQVGVKSSYVTRIIQKDKRYVEEKQHRKEQSKENHKVSKRRYIRKRREIKKQEYLAMVVQINRDNKYLSTKKQVSDLAFAKWNRGMFEYDKNSSDLVLRNCITTGYNVPKIISNVVSADIIRTNRIYV